MGRSAPDRRRARVLGHRGASAAARENTLVAFELARELGADGVELDVRLLADGALAVHHDAVLADGRPLADLHAAALPPHIPQLSEVLTICGSRSLSPALEVNVEIKNDADEPGWDPTGSTVAAAVVTEIRRAQQAGFDGFVSVSSFDRASIDAVRAVDPDLPTGWLTAARVPAWAPVLDALADAGHRALHPHHALLTAELLDAAHARGLAVAVWTVDSPARLAELVALGVDVVITNVPDVARRVVDGAEPVG